MSAEEVRLAFAQELAAMVRTGEVSAAELLAEPGSGEVVDGEAVDLDHAA
jgi:hypothetical protein